MCQAAETRRAERDARAQLRAQLPGLFPWLMFTLPSSRQDTMESRPFSGTERELLWLVFAFLESFPRVLAHDQSKPVLLATECHICWA